VRVVLLLLLLLLQSHSISIESRDTHWQSFY
jgi:hypothetical protein